MKLATSLFTSLFFLVQITDAQQIEISFNNLPANLQLYPRTKENNANVIISGFANLNTIKKISIIVNKNGALDGYSKQTLSFQNNKANFEFVKTIKAELSEYDFYVYKHISETDSTLVETRKNIVCGDVYAITGQSNSYNGIYNDGVFKPELYRGEWARSFGVFNSPDNFADYNPADTLWNYSNITNIVGMWGTELQKLIIEKYKIPVCIINGGSGGSSSEYNARRDPSNPMALNTAHGRLLYRIKKAGVEKHIKGFFYRQGENEADGATLSWKPNFETIYKNLKKDLPEIQKYYIFQNNIYTFPNFLCGLLREHQRIMQLQFPDLITFSSVGTAAFDGIHYDLAGHLQTANEVFRVLEEDFYGVKQNINTKSPNIQRATYNKDANELNLEFETGQEMVWPDVYQKDQNTNIYIEELINIEGIQANEMVGRAEGNKIILKLKSNNIGSRVSYFPAFFQQGSKYNPFVKPYLANKFGMRALTFENFPITEFEDYLAETPEIVVNKIGKQIDITISPVRDAAIYRLEYKKVDEPNFKKINLTSNEIKNYPLIINSLLDDFSGKLIYQIRCKAFSADNRESKYSNLNTISFDLNTLQNVKAKAVDSKSISLYWDEINNPSTVFIVEYAQHDTDTWQKLPLITQKNSTEILGLSPGNRYKIRMRNYVEELALYSTYTYLNNIYTLLESPINLKISKLTDISASLSWQLPNENPSAGKERKAIIEQSTDGSNYIIVNENSEKDTMAVIADLREAKKYFFRIKLIESADLYSNYSKTFEVVTLPAAPNNLEANTLAINKIKLKWNDNSQGETAFLIFVSKNNGSSFEKITETAANTNEFIVNDLLPATKYFFKTKAKGLGGESVFSNDISATTLTITGDELLSKNNALVLFPNPAKNEISFTVEKPFAKFFNAKIVGLNGQTFITKQFQNQKNKYKIDISNLISGTYIFELLDVKNRLSKKFVKE